MPLEAHLSVCLEPWVLLADLEAEGSRTWLIWNPFMKSVVGEL